MDERKLIREFIKKVFADLGDYEPFTDSDSLVISGRLSSLDVVNTVAYLESQFDFSMDPSEFEIDKFDSVDHIVDMIKCKQH